MDCKVRRVGPTLATGVSGVTSTADLPDETAHSGRYESVLTECHAVSTSPEEISAFLDAQADIAENEWFRQKGIHTVEDYNELAFNVYAPCSQEFAYRRHPFTTAATALP